MFTAVAIHANPYHRQVVHSLAVESRLVTLQRVTDDYPNEMEMARITGLPAPDLVLLDLHDPERFAVCLRQLQLEWPDTPVVGVGGTPIQHRSLAFSGVHHVLTFPLDPVSFVGILTQTIRASHAKPIPHLAAFVPAKAGCGASTVALAATTALAALPDRRVLCLDADLRSGVFALLFETPPVGSTQSVLAGVYELDHFRWDAAVQRRFGADFLLSSGEAPDPLPDWNHYFALLSFLSGRYDHILVDLPELVNPATEEVLRRAGAVYLVLTEELLALRMAERRMLDLLKWGVPDSRIFLLLNRVRRDSALAARIAESLGRPVVCRIPNDYQTVQTALVTAQWPLPQRTEVGRAYADFARLLAASGPAVPVPAPPPDAPKHASSLTGLFRSLVAGR